MAKTPDFINPNVPKTINTVSGTAHYVKTEVEDHLGRWNDNYYTRDGYWVIHRGKQHHVYKIPSKRPMTHKELLENKRISSGVRSPTIAGGKYKFPEGKGKGWREAPGRDGKAPIHKEVATRAQAKHAQNTPMKKKETNQKDIVFLNYDIMEFIKAIEEEEGINLNSEQRMDLYNYAIDNRFADDLEAYQFAIIIRLWAKGKWHPDWHPNNLKNIHEELPQEIVEIKAHMQRVKETTLFEKWAAHLNSLDRNGKGFEVFDSNSGEASIKELEKILKDGLQGIDDFIMSMDFSTGEATYEMFNSSFNEFLKDEDVDRDTIENEDEFRFKFEDHINYNTEKLFDFDVLLKDGNNRFGIESEDEDDPERKAFKKEALKYISEKQFEEIMNNASGGTGFFGIIINAQDIIKAIRDNEKTVNDNQLIIGVHDMMGGSGYFKEARAEYKMNLDKAELDEGSYSLGDIFGHVDWKWR